VMDVLEEQLCKSQDGLEQVIRRRTSVTSVGLPAHSQ